MKGILLSIFMMVSLIVPQSHSKGVQYYYTVSSRDTVKKTLKFLALEISCTKKLHHINGWPKIKKFVAELYVGESFQHYLVRNGYAEILQGNKYYYEDINAQKSARSIGLGLWNSQNELKVLLKDIKPNQNRYFSINKFINNIHFISYNQYKFEGEYELENIILWDEYQNLLVPLQGELFKIYLLKNGFAKLANSSPSSVKSGDDTLAQNIAYSKGAGLWANPNEKILYDTVKIEPNTGAPSSSNAQKSDTSGTFWTHPFIWLRQNLGEEWSNIVQTPIVVGTAVLSFSLFIFGYIRKRLATRKRFMLLIGPPLTGKSYLFSKLVKEKGTQKYGNQKFSVGKTELADINGRSTRAVICDPPKGANITDLLKNRRLKKFRRCLIIVLSVNATVIENNAFVVSVIEVISHSWSKPKKIALFFNKHDGRMDFAEDRMYTKMLEVITYVRQHCRDMSIAFEEPLVGSAFSERNIGVLVSNILENRWKT